MMYEDNQKVGLQDLDTTRIESIEELLRERGFFDSAERAEEKVLVH